MGTVSVFLLGLHCERVSAKSRSPFLWDVRKAHVHFDMDWEVRLSGHCKSKCLHNPGISCTVFLNKPVACASEGEVQ